MVKASGNRPSLTCSTAAPRGLDMAAVPPVPAPPPRDSGVAGGGGINLDLLELLSSSDALSLIDFARCADPVAADFDEPDEPDVPNVPAAPDASDESAVPDETSLSNMLAEEKGLFDPLSGWSDFAD